MIYTLVDLVNFDMLSFTDAAVNVNFSNITELNLDQFKFLRVYQKFNSCVAMHYFERTWILLIFTFSTNYFSNQIQVFLISCVVPNGTLHHICQNFTLSCFKVDS